MALGMRLEAWLARAIDAPGQLPLATTILEIAGAAREMAARIALGPLGGELGRSAGQVNQDGDVQKALDLIADTILTDAMVRAPVAVLVSEEAADARILDPDASLAVAFDPVDGSSNIDANMTIGTIFSIRPTVTNAVEPRDHFLTPGSTQLAAGIVLYGPQTSLALSIGSGVHLFVLDRTDGAFKLAATAIRVPPGSVEYAINASNHRHWEHPVRSFIDDCIKGAEGPIGRDCNMRWIGAVVGDAHRILMRGGVYLYPADRRPGYAHGRLRLIYEAQPIAFLMEQAGGAATDGVRRILDFKATGLHDRTPLIFGSADAVARVARYYGEPPSADRSPLFGRRGLLRA